MSAWEHLGRQFGEVDLPLAEDSGGEYPSVHWWSGMASKYIGRKIPCGTCGDEVQAGDHGTVHRNKRDDHPATEGRLSDLDSALSRVINSRKWAGRDASVDQTGSN